MDKNLIFDAHTHFNDGSYADEGFEIKTLVKEAQEAGVGYFLNCAFDLESSKLALEQATAYPNMFVAVGIHPMDVHNFPKAALEEVARLAKSPKVVAIGEVGLDYYWAKEHRELQKEWFKAQIDIARKNNLTLMMHIRDAKDNYEAYDDALEIIKSLPAPRMIVHCFSANETYAQKFLDLGCYINIGGAVTFKNAKDLQTAAKMIPLNRLLVETDAPYLTPHPLRGQKNFPKYISYTVAKIADLKNLTPKEIIKHTTENAFQVFNLK
ncbi:TatD DNase family protein [Entomoplasma freundtii]|uniref:Mg-dependent DNase n=1 Tax=Entomoplasma freundtii TaxID=74700 RepID=A0A2K8NQJ6_9MOLU|nr:TatD family hydrolase [Entomoplasma freundtii]ATZ16064.1 Mg-dependent DNase [Entomoplasma freundtii]TDY58067.1 TatD DNase family protein [Entomoplasma freundtii]